MSGPSDVRGRGAALAVTEVDREVNLTSTYDRRVHFFFTSIVMFFSPVVCWVFLVSPFSLCFTFLFLSILLLSSIPLSFIFASYLKGNKYREHVYNYRFEKGKECGENRKHNDNARGIKVNQSGNRKMIINKIRVRAMRNQTRG